MAFYFIPVSYSDKFTIFDAFYFVQTSSSLDINYISKKVFFHFIS